MLAFLAAVLAPLADAAPGTLDRIRQAGKITFGYRVDARPLSFKDSAGNPAGYSVAVCRRVAEQVKAELGLSALAIDWVPVTVENRFRAVEEGKIDLLCGPDTATLARRNHVSFSIPVFPGGVGALLRADAPVGLRNVLSGKRSSGPFWRGNPAEILQKKTFSAVIGTTGDQWLKTRVDRLKVDAQVVQVDSYEAGVRRVLDRSSDVFFGERAILLDAAKSSPSARDLIVLDRLFTYEPIALALARGDEDFRLVVDRGLSQLFASGEFREAYINVFGKPDESVLTFFRFSALPE